MSQTDNKSAQVSLTSPPIVISPIESSAQQICSTFVEELQQEGFKIVDPCPVCNVKVGFHQRKISVPSNHAITTHHHYTIPTAVINALPKWKVDQQHARQFLLRYEQVLSSQNVPLNYWPRSLLIGVTNVTEASWVQTNIVDANMAWKEAKELFTKHFGNYAYETDLVRRYESCVQRPKDTVQHYADYFTQLADQMNLADDNELVIQHFIEGLKPDPKQELKRQMHLEKRLKPDVQYTSLKEIIDLVLHLNSLDLNSAPKAGNRHGDDNKSSSSSSYSSPKKKLICKFHPDSHSHTTENCRTGGNKSPVRDDYKSLNKDNNQTRNKAPLKCWSCGGNHLANDPACPKYHDHQLRSKATADNKPAANVTPSSTSVQNRATTVDEAKEANANVAVSAVKLPEQVILPTQKSIMILFNDQLYNSLVDSGSDISFIDQDLVKQFKLDVDASNARGLIRFANPKLSSARVGCVKIEVKLLFPASDMKAINIQHKFEVMEVHEPCTKDYHFVIGRDMIPIIFPDALPIEYLPEANNVNGLPTICSANASLSASEDNGPTIADSVEDIIPADEQPNRIQVSTPAELDKEYSIKREVLLKELSPLLQENNAITGFCNLAESVVKLEINPELKHKLFRRQYPIAQALHEPTTAVIDRWFDTGKICYAPPGCEFNNPLTIAPKKDENGKMTGIRVCLDVRALNTALTNDDKFPIPYIRTALESFAGSSIFGELDLAEAYLQFRLHPESQPLTAFTWNRKQYMFVGCPYGITLLTSYFQRVMSLVFKDLPFVVPYVDNIPFGSTDWDQHRDHAILIVKRLTDCNLRIKPNYNIGHAQLKCLGHILSIQGVLPDPDKLQAIKDWPLPTTGKELQSFLGLGSFLRQHVRHYAELTSPLEAIKLNKDLIWNDSLIDSFNSTKQALMNAPVLTFPDFTKAFHIATDASNSGVGGVLFQPFSADEHITPTNIVAICSKKLHDYQVRYPAYKKELLGIVYCLRKFHFYVWGRHDLVIHTDHKPLTYILSSNQLSPALQQWLDVILDYDFKIFHRDGILNIIPDALSRMFSSHYALSKAWGVNNSPFPNTSSVEINISNAEIDINAQPQENELNDDSFLEGEEEAKASETNLEIELLKRVNVVLLLMNRN